MTDSNPDTQPSKVADDNTIESILGEQGKLAQLIDGYQVRTQQLEMADEIARIIEEEGTLLAEAGTGTGKTFAYLVPALLSGKRIMVSTATKNLQQQLVEKDLPLLLKVLKIDGKVRLLKGRENYICPQRFEITQTSEQHSRADWKKLSDIQTWMENTVDGDRAECQSVDENDPIWRKVCARLEFCQANDCKAELGCFYPTVKQKAQEAQVLVVNHHLFCADLALRERGFGELLPEVDVVIFDEAHQLPDIAAQFLGFSLSRGQLDELARDIRNAQKEEADEMQELTDQARAFESEVKTLNETLGKWEKRWNWQQLEELGAFEAQLKRVRNHLERLNELLKTVKERGKRLAAVQKRTEEFIAQLKVWLSPESDKQIRWAESSQARFKLNLTPLSVAGAFQRHRDEIGGAWIFTSATLTVNHQFDYFANRLGLNEAEQKVWQSPFDYAQQGVIYHPIGLPTPNTPDYVKICLRAVWPILKASNGHAFLLFTSYKALKEAADILKTHWDGVLFVQGEAPKHTLLEAFKTANNPVLLGTSSFWEGVDVKGEALKVVMIDRIPFIPPDDPVVQARESYLKEKGLNGFVHFQLPEATIAMKQGSGRLIRDTLDHGVLVLCDPRLTTKGYGQQIRNSLPDFPWVYDSKEAVAFLAAQNDKEEA
jgi:ATP-dependent DNA helicase DinG